MNVYDGYNGLPANAEIEGYKEANSKTYDTKILL
jgi:hypothetical protein